jgi:DNA invertase Pin-like site-specific DNA recombinase
MTGVGLYCRISRDPGHDELGVRRQQNDCEALCAARGWEVAQVFVDDDRSAYSGKRRPQYEALLQALRDGRIGAIVAWHPDRLHRSPKELEAFIDTVEATKAKVATVQSGDYDLTTPAGRMQARIVGAVARHESEHKSARLRRTHLELAEAGKVSGGGRTFGYIYDHKATKKVTVVAEEAKIIRDLAQRVLAGESLRSVTADLNRRGVPTVHGAPWSTTVVRRMLTSPKWAGLREHRELATPIKAVWPAILDESTHRRLVALLTGPARMKLRNPRRYLLTGLAVCALCDAKLVARPRGDKRRCYVCASGVNFKGCGKIRILADPFEEFVMQEVLDVLDTPALASVIESRGSDDDTLAEMDRIDARLAELGEMWAAGEIDRAGWAAARRRLEVERERLAGAVRVSSRADVLRQAGEKGGLAVVWPTLDFDRRRAILEAVLGSVKVGSARPGYNRFDVSRISFDWLA